MDLEAFLRLHGADLEALVEGARSLAALEPDDRLIAVGSLAEGLGNRNSDVDLLLVTPRADHDGASPDDVRSFVAGRCLVDMRIVPARMATSLRDRLAAWAKRDWALTVAADFTAGDLLLLHRLGAGRRLWPPPDAALSQDDAALGEDVARLKLHVARHMARTLQVDMAGYRDVADWPSLVYCAQDLLGHAVDGLLAGARLTNPTPKWRSRLLDRLAADWEARLVTRPSGLSASALMWRLHRAPAEATAASAITHAGRVVTFARAAFLAAEQALIRPSPGLARPRVWLDQDANGRAPLPGLDLDIDFHRTAEGVRIGRLNAFGETLLLTDEDFTVLLLFDGRTTAQEAASVIRGETSAKAVLGVEGIAETVRRAGLVAADRPARVSQRLEQGVDLVPAQ